MVTGILTLHRPGRDQDGRALVDRRQRTEGAPVDDEDAAERQTTKHERPERHNGEHGRATGYRARLVDSHVADYRFRLAPLSRYSKALRRYVPVTDSIASRTISGGTSSRT